MNDNDTPAPRPPVENDRTDKPPRPLHIACKAHTLARAKLMQDAADADHAAGAGIEAIFMKAFWMEKVLTRIVEKMNTPEASHLKDDTDEYVRTYPAFAMTQSPEAIAHEFKTLGLGVKLGAVPVMQKIVLEILKEKEKAERTAKEEAEKQKQARRAKNNRPRWGEEERRIYDAKILTLISAGMSDRQIADAIPTWAGNNTNVNGCRIPSNSALQKWAATMRDKKKRRKRAH